MGACSRIETLLNPFLRDPCHPVVKLDAIQIFRLRFPVAPHYSPCHFLTSNQAKEIAWAMEEEEDK